MTSRTKKAVAAVKPKPPGNVSKSARLNADHVQRAEELASRKGVDFTAIMQMALAEYLDRNPYRP